MVPYVEHFIQRRSGRWAALGQVSLFWHPTQPQILQRKSGLEHNCPVFRNGVLQIGIYLFTFMKVLYAPWKVFIAFAPSIQKRI